MRSFPIAGCPAPEPAPAGEGSRASSDRVLLVVLIRRKGTKPEHRAGWVLDIQIASCVWTHGRELVTDNTRDFEILRDLMAGLYPDTSPLTVTGP